jgi:hypothetical protein
MKSISSPALALSVTLLSHPALSGPMIPHTPAPSLRGRAVSEQTPAVVPRLLPNQTCWEIVDDPGSRWEQTTCSENFMLACSDEQDRDCRDTYADIMSEAQQMPATMFYIFFDPNEPANCQWFFNLCLQG